jgi:hypothetical protein
MAAFHARAATSPKGAVISWMTFSRTSLVNLAPFRLLAVGLLIGPVFGVGVQELLDRTGPPT